MARTHAHSCFSPKKYAQGGAVRQAKQAKIEKVMHEYGQSRLHSGSKTGPVVKDHKQAVAIAMSEAGRGKK